MEPERKTKETEKLCQRCKRSYIDSSNDASSCRFHPSFFVSRRHDDQKSYFWCSCLLVLAFIILLVPEIRYFMYYELGPEDPPYAAKFYDCCGAEDPNAPGCVTSPHISYDD